MINGTHYDVHVEVGREDMDPQAAVPAGAGRMTFIARFQDPDQLTDLRLVSAGGTVYGREHVYTCALTRLHTASQSLPLQHHGQRAGAIPGAGPAWLSTCWATRESGGSSSDRSLARTSWCLMTSCVAQSGGWAGLFLPAGKAPILLALSAEARDATG